MQPKVAITLLAALSASACGLKGPLYRPEERQEAAQTTPAETDKQRRPRPAPQVQKEDRPTAVSPPVSPVDPERAPGTLQLQQSPPADGTQ